MAAGPNMYHAGSYFLDLCKSLQRSTSALHVSKIQVTKERLSYWMPIQKNGVIVDPTCGCAVM